jgi:hypothetical protein
MSGTEVLITVVPRQTPDALLHACRKERASLHWIPRLIVLQSNM